MNEFLVWVRTMHAEDPYFPLAFGLLCVGCIMAVGGFLLGIFGRRE